MLEADFTGKLLKRLRHHRCMQKAVIFKHNDFYTAGIPDFSITHKSKISWWEVKIHPNTPTALQAATLGRLYPASYLLTYAAADCIYIRHIGGLETKFSFDEAVEYIVGEAYHHEPLRPSS